MSYNLPKPRVLSLTLQCLCMVAFAICLYLFGNAYQANNQYKAGLSKLQQRQQQLNQAYEQVDKYMKFIDTNPYYQKNLGEPQWEKVDEAWVGLSYDKLMERLSSLYREDRPFILDYFSASLVKDMGMTVDGENRAEDTVQNRKLTFHLQGYYLCPCQ